MPKYKLTYFDGRGGAEYARLLFAAAGVKYEDVRITKEQWPELKGKTPFGQLPTLEVDGKQFAQSLAIASYLAREFGFYGKDNLEAFAIDQVVHLVSEAWALGIQGIIETDEVKKAVLQKSFAEEAMPRYLGLYSKLLKENGTGYFVGNSLTMADLIVYESIYSMQKRTPPASNASENFPEIKSLFDNILSNENIKAYVDQRKDTPF